MNFNTHESLQQIALHHNYEAATHKMFLNKPISYPNSK